MLEIIKAAYPKAVMTPGGAGSNYLLENIVQAQEGDGDSTTVSVISYWNEEAIGAPKPTEQELAALAASAVAAALPNLKAMLRAQIDADAERERQRYITPGSGQAMTYARKLEEARAADSEINPIPQDYPLLAASVGIEGATIADIANLVLAMDAQWTVIGAAIEAVRLSTKKAITDAVDEEAARTAFDALEWPAPP